MFNCLTGTNVYQNTIMDSMFTDFILLKYAFCNVDVTNLHLSGVQRYLRWLFSGGGTPGIQHCINAGEFFFIYRTDALITRPGHVLGYSSVSIRTSPYGLLHIFKKVIRKVS